MGGPSSDLALIQDHIFDVPAPPPSSGSHGLRHVSIKASQHVLYYLKHSGKQACQRVRIVACKDQKNP